MTNNDVLTRHGLLSKIQCQTWATTLQGIGQGHARDPQYNITCWYHTHSLVTHSD